jgi:TonB family protein
MRCGAATLVAGIATLGVSLPLASAKGQADSPPVLHADSSNVRFPSILASARVDGRAHATATIDSTGRIAGLRVEGSHDLFASAAKAAMTKFSFDAARRDAKAIADTIDVEFEFRLPKSPVVPTIAVWRVEHDRARYRIVVGWDSVGHASPAPVLNDSDTNAARHAIIIASRLDPSAGKDPLSVEFSTFEAWTSDVVGAQVKTYDYPPPPKAVLGGGGRHLWCQAVRSNPRSPWVARCDMLGAWVS